ncbi:hypothetical protein FJZ17_03405 [Candidatus Pacearchaeota archaeon]|nr:hypothetical protein [Candidatus Pacearchaeota archaeon]
MNKLDKKCRLITADRFGADIILKEYPEIIHNIKRCKMERGVVYDFSEIDSTILEEFLSKYPLFSYAIVDLHSN